MGVPLLLAGALWSAPALVRAQGAAGAKRHRSGQSTAPPLKGGPLLAADAAAIAQKWGIHIEGMALASGGYMLEFRYRILDAPKAQPLFNPRLRPILKDDGSEFESVVPNPPTTGSLRSTYDAKAGRTYFMFFANPFLEYYQHPKLDFDSVLSNIRYKPVSKQEIVELIPFMIAKFTQINRSKNNDAGNRWIMGQLNKMAMGNMNLPELNTKVTEAYSSNVNPKNI